MSSTIENLKEAIKGENNAKLKYELFAKKAKEEDLPEIAHLFEAISYAESIHIKNHLRVLSKLTNSEVDLFNIVPSDEKSISISNTKDNLIQAIEGETYEFKKMYKAFMKTAKKRNRYLAEFSFDLARKAELIHSKLFKKYLKKLVNNESFDKVDIYVCSICGNVELERAPKTCPNCQHDQKFFIKL